MALRPINQEQVQGTAQILLAFLSDERVLIPGNLLDGIISGKSLLRGILSGSLVLCSNAKDEVPPEIRKAVEDMDIDGPPPVPHDPEPTPE